MLVPLIHAGQFPLLIGGWEQGVWIYVGSYFAESAIFTLFLMSGYLFFCGSGDDRSIWMKLWHRVKRLLVPFLLWGCVFCAMYALAGRFSPRAAERLATADVGSAKGFFLAVFNFTRPLVYGPLWFLRALFYLAVAGAVAKLLARRMRTRFQRSLVIVLCAAAILVGVPRGALAAIVPSAGIALYFLGGLLATWECAPQQLFRRGRWGWLGLLVVGTLALFGARLLELSCPIWVEQLVWFVSAFAFWGWAKELSVFATHAWCTKWLLPTGFFVFVIHMFINRVIFHAAAAHACRVAGWLTIISLFAFIISIAVPMVIWHLMHRICPRLVVLLEGGRWT